MNSENRRRDGRLRVIKFSRSVNFAKWEIMAMLRSLPEDAEIVRWGIDKIAVWSSTFELVAPGMVIPEIQPVITTFDVEAEKNSILNPPPVQTHVGRFSSKEPNMQTVPRDAANQFKPGPTKFIQEFADSVSQIPTCICDTAYTGLKTHRRDCPVKR